MSGIEVILVVLVIIEALAGAAAVLLLRSANKNISEMARRSQDAACEMAVALAAFEVATQVGAGPSAAVLAGLAKNKSRMAEMLGRDRDEEPAKNETKTGTTIRQSAGVS